MIGILPGRLATRQRLLVGAVIVAGVSLFNLIGLKFGPLGSPWPIALLWAACGWSGLGPNVTTAALLFALGLWVDMLTGTPLGTWALIVLLTHAIIIAMARFLGLGNFSSTVNALMTGAVMLAVMMGFGFWHDGRFYILGVLLSLGTAVLLYPVVSKYFELSEDEA